MALRSEKARFEKNVRQEHEADYISVFSSSLRSRFGGVGVPLLRLCSRRRLWQIKNSVNLRKSASKTFVFFRGEYLCDLGVYLERSRMGALWQKYKKSLWPKKSVSSGWFRLFRTISPSGVISSRRLALPKRERENGGVKTPPYRTDKNRRQSGIRCRSRCSCQFLPHCQLQHLHLSPQL